MQTKTALRRLGVVAGLTAGLVGIGSASASAFAASTAVSTDSEAIIGTAPCPSGWTGIEVIVDGVPIIVCTNI